MQGSTEMGEHGAQPLAVHDPPRQIAKLVLHADELPSQAGGARSRRTFMTKKRLIMGDDAAT